MSNQFFDLRPMFLIDYHTFDIIDVSSRATERYGYTKEELTSMKITDLGGPVDSNGGTGIRNVTMESDTIWCHRNKEGEEFHVRFSLHPIAEQEQFLRLAIAHEVNGRSGNDKRGLKPLENRRNKESSENFKMSVESYKALFDAIGDAICLYDNKGRFIEVNDGTVKMYGYKKNDFVGEDLSMLAAPGKVAMTEIKECFNRVLKGKAQRFEFWGKRKNGEVFPQEIILNPGYYFGQQVIIAIARDITEQHQREIKIKKSEEMFRQLFKNAPIGIALLDEHKEVTLVNEGFEQIFGFSQEEILGLDIDKVLVSEEPDGRKSQQLLNKKIFEVSSRIKRKKGEAVEVLVYGVPVIVEAKTIAIYGIYVDITERKNAEEKVRRSLKEKEVLLAEIHHRVKNNLAVVTGLLELQREHSSNEGARSTLKDSQMRIYSMALIHEKLYQSENLSQIQFDNYIRELVGVIGKSHLLDDVQVNFQIEAEAVPLTIKQAIPCGLLLNEIVTNSLKHAFPDHRSGEIVICFRMEGEKLLFEISDNGIGLPDDFETIKFRSLGVTLINTLSKQLGARLHVLSEKGTKYSILFDHEK